MRNDEYSRNKTKKELAIELTFVLDEEQRIYEEDLQEHEEDQIREWGKHVRELIYKSGFDIQEIMFLSEQYKTLKVSEYFKWVSS